MKRFWSTICRARFVHTPHAKPTIGLPVAGKGRLRHYSTADQDGIVKFSKMTDMWWDLSGPIAPLHAMNSLRVPFVVSNSPQQPESGSEPLRGLNILDAGCGAGILSKPMARLGAKVCGLDATPPLIEAAKAEQASLDEPILSEKLSYICTTVEEHAVEKQAFYDVVVMSEVVEHVPKLDLFLQSCAQMTKPDGSLVVTTISRTWPSYFLFIIAFEYLFNVIPRGAHQWKDFVTPAELQQKLENNGCLMTSLRGMSYNPLTKSWRWTKGTSMCYASSIKKIAS